MGIYCDCSVYLPSEDFSVFLIVMVFSLRCFMFLRVYKPPPLILSYSAGNVHTGLLVLYVIVRYIRNIYY